eukprot:1727669-Rhodomonas_salina.1
MAASCAFSHKPPQNGPPPAPPPAALSPPAARSSASAAPSCQHPTPHRRALSRHDSRPRCASAWPPQTLSPTRTPALRQHAVQAIQTRATRCVSPANRARL